MPAVGRLCGGGSLCSQGDWASIETGGVELIDLASLSSVLISPPPLSLENWNQGKSHVPFQDTWLLDKLEAEVRIELTNTGFANPRLTTWLLRLGVRME